MMMRYFQIIIVSILLAFGSESPVLAQIDPNLKTQLKIEPATHDLGTIKEVDGVVKVKFTITNISKKPYIMNYSYAGCGCVTAKVTKEPLMPGKSRDIDVEFDPKRRPGMFNKDVMLISNNRKRADKLNLKGEVIPRPKSLMELYPVKTIDGVMLSEDVLPFGILSQNEKNMGVINYYNDSKSTVNVELKVSGNKEGSAVLSRKSLAPNSSGQLQFTYDLRGGTYYGELKNEIELIVNGKRWGTTIKVNALVVFNFFDMSDEERAKAPRAIIAPLDYTVAGYQQTITVPILNNGKSDLKVLTVIASDNISYTLKNSVITPGKETELTICLKKNSEGNLTLLFNSPDTPVVTINVKLKK